MTAPASALLASAVDDARRGPAGRVTAVYPALAAVDPALLAAAVRPVAGAPTAAGHADARFILMSVAKPFVLALAVDALGAERVLALTGMRETGRAFNDPAAITDAPDGRTNPMVNPGAITASSLLGGGDVRAGEAAIREGLSAFAGRALAADAVMVDAIHATNERNRVLAGLLAEHSLLGCDLEDALHLYTYQSCLGLTVRELARMGAVLAHGGLDPVSGARVVSEEAAAIALEAMALAGLYEATASWRAEVGLPAKSGIAGGLVMVAPGAGALAAYSPGLDPTGNPLRAQRIARTLAPALLS
ncbi:glutaminase [Demequina sp. SYSU T00192]|uniref:glutaminase n=1 Tax=Demequina litoralis TaxID=3051660 RepID=A0ABT8G6T0_9MICO|nr:glutaminase [Demequina sp. SYSU T00192]MDN4474394.1 glutaminase [Demequina sp. SYSU T00192]